MHPALHGICLVVTYLIMLFALAGTIVPLVPGLPLVFGAALLYGLLTNFARIGAGPLVALGLIAAVAQVCDYLAGAWGAHKFGGGKWGIVGAIVGGLVGAIVFNIPGLILGAVVGATAGELAAGREFEESARTGLGTLVGFLAGRLVAFTAGVVMIGVFTIVVVSG
jgi:uncharacterized protein YqgC (DUF456 family)